MALRLGALHDALLNAGTDAALAQKAAEEVANYEQQLAGVRTDLAILKWMAGFNVAATMTVLWKVFS